MVPPETTAGQFCGLVLPTVDGLLLVATTPAPRDACSEDASSGLAMPLPALARSASDPLPAVADSARAGAGLRATMVQPGGRPLSSWLALEVSPEEESSLPRTGRLRRSLPAWTKPSGENKERVRVCVKIKSLHEGTFLHRLGYREFSNSVDTERLAPVHC